MTVKPTVCNCPPAFIVRCVVMPAHSNLSSFGPFPIISPPDHHCSSLIMPSVLHVQHNRHVRSDLVILSVFSTNTLYLDLKRSRPSHYFSRLSDIILPIPRSSCKVFLSSRQKEVCWNQTVLFSHITSPHKSQYTYIDASCPPPRLSSLKGKCHSLFCDVTFRNSVLLFY